MKRYCLINQIKPDKVEAYINAHQNVWPELLTFLRDEAKTDNELIYIYGNLGICFVECEDINIFLDAYGKSELGTKWLENMACLLAESPFANENGEANENVEGLRKVFDMKQQLKGEFTQY